MTPKECETLAERLMNEFGVDVTRIQFIVDDEAWLRKEEAMPEGIAVQGQSGLPLAVWYEPDRTNYGVPTERVFERLPSGELRGGFNLTGLDRSVKRP